MCWRSLCNSVQNVIQEWDRDSGTDEADRTAKDAPGDSAEECAAYDFRGNACGTDTSIGACTVTFVRSKLSGHVLSFHTARCFHSLP